MSSYPVTFESQYVERRSRLTTFFRLLLAIPHLFLLMLMSAAAVLVVIVAWFMLLVTGRWSPGMYEFVAGFLRYYTRVHAYVFLLTDPYPPFSMDDDPDYPARLRVGPALPEYSRLKVLLRIFYAIPALLIVYVMNLVVELAAFAAWFVIVITGKQPKGLQDVIGLCVSYVARANALFLLVTETYPPFTDDQAAQQIGRPPPAEPLPTQPETSSAPENPTAGL